ncbi:MAG: phosphatase PAP2 family protein [Xanthomonadales bacterium]
MSVLLGERRAWPPGRRFWVVHFWLPLLVFALLAVVFETTPLDLWIADVLFALEGGRWTLQHHWFTYDVMHHYGKLALIAFGLGVLVLAVLSCCLERLKPWRWPLAYLATGLVLVPATIGFGKHFSDVPCPWDLARYGGEDAYRHSLDYAFGWVGSHSRSCFPAGHAAGGFGLLVVYFAAWPYARRPAWFLLPGLLVGEAFGLAQQVRGAHFVSHDLWTLALTWFAALGLFVLFRPARWGGGEARSTGNKKA